MLYFSKLQTQKWILIEGEFIKRILVGPRNC